MGESPGCKRETRRIYRSLMVREQGKACGCTALRKWGIARGWTLMMDVKKVRWTGDVVSNHFI